MAIGKKLRFEVFKRDSFTCLYCGRMPPAVTLEVDHVHPSAKGGSDEIDNLLTACFDCNRGKSDRALDGPVTAGVDLQEKLIAQQERAEQLKQYNDFRLEQRAEYERLAMVISDRWIVRIGGNPKKTMVSEDRLTSIRMFIEKLSAVDVLDAVDIAFGKKPGSKSYDNATWKYFCGVCWTKIKRASGEDGDPRG